MPCHANHETAVVTPVRWPPALAVDHQLVKVLLQSIDIQFLKLFAIVEVRSKRIGLGVVLVQDVQV